MAGSGREEPNCGDGGSLKQSKIWWWGFSEMEEQNMVIGVSEREEQNMVGSVRGRSKKL